MIKRRDGERKETKDKNICDAGTLLIVTFRKMVDSKGRRIKRWEGKCIKKKGSSH